APRPLKALLQLLERLLRRLNELVKRHVPVLFGELNDDRLLRSPDKPRAELPPAGEFASLSLHSLDPAAASRDHGRNDARLALGGLWPRAHPPVKFTPGLSPDGPVAAVAQRGCLQCALHRRRRSCQS